MSNVNMHTYNEICAQSEALHAAWEQLRNQQDWLRKYIGNTQFEQVIFIGSGSSWYQAMTMAAAYRAWTGRPAAAHPSSDLFLFRNQTVTSALNTLLVGVSRSGESHEVILALESVQDLTNWTTCGITCYTDSKMAKMTECLVSPLGQEKSTVMTKSLSSMTFMMQAAIAQAYGHHQAIQQLEAILQSNESIVTKADKAARKWVESNSFTKTIYLGMGSMYGLALEACLKLKEMTYTWTEAYGTLEFRHGPKSIVDADTQVILLLSEQARDYELKVAKEMKQYGASIVLVAAREGEETQFADCVMNIGHAELMDDARSVLYLPFVQYNGYYTAVARGLNPDDPRNLTQFVSI
ncbi:SIS domain-containing protein [Paenibacillus sp. UMB4589-SE434]|uniref:SIS domain-containing protein n=1 Tax=Paenibacillus sp. UMB4589-SE434 TaxID=3046314 RepID=UPI00254F5837|nr:SIS domain-containing protein [Paenibacillus sp. UMB4589-SE434]MDK8182695.1 SIS domain-containing protein [Paenibacillus sp. UMB4589-SE434]